MSERTAYVVTDFPTYERDQEFSWMRVRLPWTHYVFETVGYQVADRIVACCLNSAAASAARRLLSGECGRATYTMEGE